MLDVITAVSDVVQYHSSSRSEPSTKRSISIMDLMYAILPCQVLVVCVVVSISLPLLSVYFVYILCTGCQITIVLWGERATTFQGDYIIELGSIEPVVALFVGTLVKAYEGKNSC